MSERKKGHWQESQETPTVPSLVAVWEGFKAKTTAHAVPHLHHAQGKTPGNQLLVHD